MSVKSTVIKIEIRDYLNDYYSSLNDEITKRLLLEAQNNGIPAIHISIEQAAFLQWLIRSFDVKKILEIGTLAGYSALIMARALNDNGSLITLEKNERFAPIARKYWKMAGVDKTITMHITMAEELLPKLIDKGQYFDLIFIDADKNNYDYYYEAALKLINTKGIIAIDNTFAFGRINEKTFSSPEVEAVRRLNMKINSDKRVQNLLLPLGDGLTLVQKKEF